MMFLIKMDRSKTAGSHEIVIKMMSAIDNFEINMITEIANEIYDSGEIS